MEETVAFIWKGKIGLSDKCSDPTETASVVGMVVGTTHQKNEECQ